MGSLAEVVLIGDDERQLAAAAEVALDEIERLSQRWSRFLPASEISRINRDAARGRVLVDRELFAVLAECDRWRRLTDGAFDITAGSWRAGDSPRLSGADVELDAAQGAVRFRTEGLRLDLGAYGKGAASTWRERCCESCSWTTGCCRLAPVPCWLAAAGRPATAGPWRCGIRISRG